MMERTSVVKLSFLVLVAIASCLSPFTAEARHRHVHHRYFHHHVRPSPVPPPPAPTTEPTSSPNDGIAPYQIHGCGYLCSDSNDCDWPCTICGQNQTCSYDEPFIFSDPFPSPSEEEPVPAPTMVPTDGVVIPSLPSAAPAPQMFPTLPSAPTPAIAPALAPSDGIDVQPYQIHGFGYPCSDSNDCDWPSTVCCANQTCCYDEPMAMPSLSSSAPLSSLPPLFLSQAPTPPPSSGDEADDELAPTPPYYYEYIGVPGALPPEGYVFSPYQVHGCGYGPCTDSNDCDWPCTSCCANYTCCGEEDLPTIQNYRLPDPEE